MCVLLECDTIRCAQAQTGPRRRSTLCSSFPDTHSSRFCFACTGRVHACVELNFAMRQERERQRAKQAEKKLKKEQERLKAEQEKEKEKQQQTQAKEAIVSGSFAE